MTLATLCDVLPAANARGAAVLGFVCLGWEDARAYARAAEAAGSPAILQVGPSARAHMPLRAWGPMLRALGEGAGVPVVVHLDHGASVAECREAIESGFTSVMLDGSRLTLDENIAVTREARELAHAHGVSCEGEIGFVGYSDGAVSNPTDPAEAARFARETGIDAMAVSVGNVHLQTSRATRIDRDALAAIEAGTIEAGAEVPLVLHGSSGLVAEDRRWAARGTRVAKMNLGTELRRAFGAALRGVLTGDGEVFDRRAILAATEPAMEGAAHEAIAEVWR